MNIRHEASWVDLDIQPHAHTQAELSRAHKKGCCTVQHPVDFTLHHRFYGFSKK